MKQIVIAIGMLLSLAACEAESRDPAGSSSADAGAPSGDDAGAAAVTPAALLRCPPGYLPCPGYGCVRAGECDFIE